MSKHKEKAKRVDRISNSIDREYVLEWLPEVNAIYDDELREKTTWALNNATPDSFWTEPSSSSGKYHSIDECGKFGNVLHTKRVFAEYANISESWVEAGWIEPKEKEEGKVAALLHDTLKYGWPSDDNDHTVNDHDVIAAEVARHIVYLPESICEIISRHMGPWGSGPNPQTDNQKLLHTADKSAARRYNEIGIYQPAEELTNEWPDVIVEELEEEQIV